MLFHSKKFYFALFAVVTLTGYVTANESISTAPILQLNTGGHMAAIRDIAYTPDGRYLLSASDDKTVRVWDLINPEAPARIIRGQVGEGDYGKIYAMALSPDGRTVAVGGFLAASELDIRLQDVATGQVLGLLRGHENVVLALTFSPDGRRLVSGSADQTAIVWDVANRRQEQRLRGHTDNIYAVGFTPDGKRVVTGSYDHDLRLWAVASGELLARMTGHTDKVQSLAVSPDGTIASGSWDHTIRLWDGQTGRFLKTLADQGTRVGSLSFSPDGRRLLSGVGYGVGYGKDTYCHVWSVPDGKELRRYEGHDNGVVATAFAPDGRTVATGGGNNNEIDLWDPKTGQLQRRLVGGGTVTWAVGISDDGSRIAWGNTWATSDINRGPLEYQLSLTTDGTPQLGTPQALPAHANFRRAVNTNGEWSLQHAKGGNYGNDYAILEIRRNGQVQSRIERGPADGYGHYAYTFTPNGETIISGGAQGFLTAYNRSGQKLGDFVGHTSGVWAVATSSDGRLLVSGSYDQTVRLWNVNSRELLMTLFMSRDTKQWVVWTRSGYYLAAPGSEDLIGWQINQGPDQTPKYFPAARFRDQFARADVIEQMLMTLNETSAIQQADAARGSKTKMAAIETRLPPVIYLLAPNNDATFTSNSVTVRYQVNTPADAPLIAIKPLVDGRPISNARGFKRESNQNTGELTLTLPERDLTLALIGENRHGSSEPAQIRLKWGGEKGFTKASAAAIASATLKPKLYILAIGVSEYQSPGANLRFPAKDAQDFVQVMTLQNGKLYQEVKSKLLPNATQKQVLEGLEWLEQEVTGKDVAMLFLSGHGEDDRGTYYFISSDANPDRLKSTAVNYAEITDTLQKLPSKVVMFLDTCHAGNVMGNSHTTKSFGGMRIDEIVNDLVTAENGVVVFASSTGRQLSLEDPDWNNGAFTKAVVEGLSGKADQNHAGSITISQLEYYISERVKELTKNKQTPTTTKPKTIPNFPLAATQ